MFFDFIEVIMNKLKTWLIIITSLTGVWGKTYTAVNCTQSEVQKAITAATYNDTVVLPSDTATWTVAGGTVGFNGQKVALLVRKGIVIKGSKSSNGETRIEFVNGYNEFGFQFWFDQTTISNDYLVEISNITFDANGSTMKNEGLISVHGGDTTITRHLIIHDNTFLDCESKAIVVNALVYGVVYNNTFTDVGYSVTAFGGDYKAWQRVAQLRGTVDNLFIEDNTINFTKNSSRSGGTDHGQGAPGFVFRYNTMNFTNKYGGYPFIIHGLQTMKIASGFTCPSGCGYSNCLPTPVGSCNENEPSCEQWSTIKSEYYGNLILNGTINLLMAQRGGTLMMFNNFLTTSASLPDINYSQYACNSCQKPRLAIEYDQKVKGTYVFSNYGNTTRINMTKGLDYCSDNSVEKPYTIKENVDYWNQATNFDGKTGIGCGPVPPSMAALAGVGYWVSDSCNKVQKTMDGIKNATQNGKFYIHNGASWIKAYEPYYYPHPLRLKTGLKGMGLYQ